MLNGFLKKWLQYKLPTEQFFVELFHNYGFKEWIFFERLEIVAICTVKNTFLMAILLKLTLDIIFFILTV